LCFVLGFAEGEKGKKGKKINHKHILCASCSISEIVGVCEFAVLRFCGKFKRVYFWVKRLVVLYRWTKEEKWIMSHKKQIALYVVMRPRLRKVEEFEQWISNRKQHKKSRGGYVGRTNNIQIVIPEIIGMEI
jgi:hypothetical protein